MSTVSRIDWTLISSNREGSGTDSSLFPGDLRSRLGGISARAVIITLGTIALQLPAIAGGDSAHKDASAPLQTYLWQLVVIGALVWASSNGFKSLVHAITKQNLRREIIALILGPLAALVAHEAGFIPCGPGLWKCLSVAFYGLVCTMIAVGGHQLAQHAIQTLRPPADDQKDNKQ